MKKQMNKIPNEVVPALCNAVMDTSVVLTKTGYTGSTSLFIFISKVILVLKCVPPAVNHLYRGAVTVHRHLNGQSSLLGSAPSAPLQVESTSQGKSNGEKNKSTEKSETENTSKTGKYKKTEC